MNTTVGEAISRLKNAVKAVKQDAFVTDRFVYSLINKHVAWLVRREDSTNKILRIKSAFTTLDMVELIEIPKADLDCPFLNVEKIKRSKHKIPKIVVGYWGPLIRSVSSIDGGTVLYDTYPSIYEKMTMLKNFKYNKHKYYWYQDGYLYFPDLEWDFVKVDALFENAMETAPFSKNYDPCKNMQDYEFHVPGFLFAEIESQVLNEMFNTLKIPTDIQHDKQHIAR